MQGDDEHQMDTSAGVFFSQLPRLQLLDDNLEEADGAPERRSPDCVIAKEKDPTSGLSRRLKNITMEEENVSEVMGPSSHSKHSLPSISQETNQKVWNTILSSSMERGRNASHRSSDSQDSSLLHSPDYYGKDSYKNMLWDDEETASNWSRSERRSISRTLSTRPQIRISSPSNPLSNIEKYMVELRRKMGSLLLPQNNKVGVVRQGMRVQELLLRIDEELELARKLPEAREVWLPDLWIRGRKLKQSIGKLQRRAGIMVSEIRYVLSEFDRQIDFMTVNRRAMDRIRTYVLLKSHAVIGVEGYDDSSGRLVVAFALAEALNLFVCFDTVIWVRVSDYQTVDGIRNEITKGLGISFDDDQSASENNLHLRNILTSTRFLLVLDDLQFPLNYLPEIGIPHPSILSESGSMVVVITKNKYNITSAQDIIYIYSSLRIEEDVYFVLNAGEGIKWYGLDEVRQLHRRHYGDHL